MNWCAFCMDINAATMLKRGVDRAKLAELANFVTSRLFSDREKAALAYAEAVSDSDSQPTSEDLNRLREHFDDNAIIELTALIAFQNLSSKFNAALGAEPLSFCTVAPKPKRAECPLPRDLMAR